MKRPNDLITISIAIIIAAIIITWGNIRVNRYAYFNVGGAPIIVDKINGRAAFVSLDPKSGRRLDSSIRYTTTMPLP